MTDGTSQKAKNVAMNAALSIKNNKRGKAAELTENKAISISAISDNDQKPFVKVRAKPQTKSSRAGILFPVGRIHRQMKNHVSHF